MKLKLGTPTQLVVLLLLLVLLALILFSGQAATLDLVPGVGTGLRDELIWLVAVLILLVVLWRMLHVFTVPLHPDEQEEELDGSRDVIRFGYGAMILALLFSVVLFMIPFLWQESHRASSVSPIGVLKGCRVYPAAVAGRAISSVDDPLACHPYGPQWVLNIGGSVTPHPDLRAELAALDVALTALAQTVATPASASMATDADAAVLRDGQLLEQLRAIRTQLGERGDAAETALAALIARLGATETAAATPGDTAEAEPEEAGRATQPAVDAARASSAPTGVIDPLAAVTAAQSALARALDPGASPTPGLVCVGGACGYGIRGGLVLPLYIIVFSLFGGAISMTRRLPELQKRATNGYRSYFQRHQSAQPALKTPLAAYEVREYVVFLIMQTLSAPLIAATVYSLVEPRSLASIVVIGFAAGFASEPILLQLRKLAEKISGDSSQYLGTGEPRADSDEEAQTPVPNDGQGGGPGGGQGGARRGGLLPPMVGDDDGSAPAAPDRGMAPAPARSGRGPVMP